MLRIDGTYRPNEIDRGYGYAEKEWPSGFPMAKLPLTMSVRGIHHVTAIAGGPQQNIDFYTGVLGLRLVKRTVNFDDPLTYHFYYGTETGAPGTILTFFAWPGAARGGPGNSQVNATALSVPKGSLPWWQERFKQLRVGHDLPVDRFGTRVLPFQDGDGLMLELVEIDEARDPWRGGGVPEEAAIRGIHGITAREEGYEQTARLLTETLRFQPAGQEGNRFRYDAGGEAGFIDIVCTPDGPRARGGAGTVHHVAWRVPDDADQIAWRTTLVGAGLNVSPVLDRQYFHSIYFREPGGVLFEIATDSPGMAIDESLDRLGETLRLPPWLDQARTQIEAGLEPISTPAPASQ